MLKFMEKYKEYIIVICFVILVVLRIVPFKSTVDMTIDTVRYKFNDTDYSEPIQVSVSGVYYNYLAKEDRFEGKITFNGYDDFEILEDYTLTFNGERQHLTYITPSQDKYVYLPEFESVGTVYADRKFKNLVIFPYDHMSEDKSWSTRDGYFIDVFSTDRNDALDKAKRIFVKEYGDRVDLNRIN